MERFLYSIIVDTDNVAELVRVLTGLKDVEGFEFFYRQKDPAPEHVRFVVDGEYKIISFQPSPECVHQIILYGTDVDFVNFGMSLGCAEIDMYGMGRQRLN